MQYAIIAAAVVGLAAAAPANEWEPVPTTTPAWEPVTTTTTSTWGWEPVKKTTTPAWEPVKVTTKATTWSEWAPVPTTTKCSSVSTWTTKECSGSGEWANCKDVTKYSTYYPEKCATTTWADWVPIPTTKCSSTSTYTTKECSGTGEWANCKDVTKYTVVYPTVCPTPKAPETWAPAPAPVKPTTWAPAVVATTSAWNPVATFKGAADKQVVGMGAIAIAAVAALL